MRKHERCHLAVLAVALRQSDSGQVRPFKHTLDCVRALVHFTMMAQYQSHTPETIAYMEEHLDWFHRMKDILLQFQVSQQTGAKFDEQRKEIQHHRAQRTKRVPRCNRPLEDEGDEENDLRMDMIHTESQFNFVQMHLLSHFSNHWHIRQFGNIPQYFTEFRELAHKEQIKDGWRRSNKHDVMRQILHSYRRRHAI